MDKVGKIEDERNEPMTDFNRIEEIMPPFIDLVPIDDQDGERENIQTGSEDAPYKGVIWNVIPRPAIAEINAIFSSVEQMGSPDTCIRVMLQKAHDDAGQFIQEPKNAP